MCKNVASRVKEPAKSLMQSLAHLAQCKLSVVGSNLIKGSRCSLSKRLYPHCSVLVGCRDGFESNFTIKLKYIEGLITEDRLKCQISSLVK